MKKLDGKVAVVTGGANGIGRAIAEIFAAEGAGVAIADVDLEAANALVRAIEAGGGRATAHRCDVSREEDVAALMAAVVEASGRLDVLVNNAGIFIAKGLSEMSTAERQRIFDINLGGALLCCKHAIPHLLRGGGGAIVNMASVHGHVGLPGATAYAASKGGVLAMTRQLAVEFGPKGIRVNSISPGAIMTPMNDRLLAEAGDELLPKWVHMHAMERVGQADEVARAALYLASADSSFVTGIDVRVDGGLVATPRFTES